MKRIGIYIAIFLALVLTVVLISSYSNSKKQIIENEELDINIELGTETVDCVETQAFRCFRSSATGTTFVYPRELGELNVKTRFQYLAYDPSKVLGTVYECLYEDIQSSNKDLTIYIIAGTISNEDCERTFESTKIRDLTFTKGNNVYKGYIESIVTKAIPDTILFSARGSVPIPEGYVFGEIRVFSSSFETLSTILNSLDMDLSRRQIDYFMAIDTVELYGKGNKEEIERSYVEKKLLLDGDLIVD
jgi:hypothetical protein